MEVVITGANSFIGYRYLKAALNKGWNIVAVVRRNSLKTKELNNNWKYTSELCPAFVLKLEK